MRQSSCVQDELCVDGECPSFVTVRPAAGVGLRRMRPESVEEALPEPTKPLVNPYVIYAVGRGGTGVVTNDDDDVKTGNAAGREAGIKHVAALHWALDSYGTLNDVWYCVKCIGMVNSHGGASFSKSPEVVNGYSKVFHDVFGGPLSEFAKNGADSSQSGWHARSAVGGFDLPGHCMIEPEMIVQIDPELALCIIKERGPCL